MFFEQNKKSILAVLMAVFFAEIIRTAWISDDAAITLRTVLNFLHGFGPVFNIDERVQAYTHPLWFILISTVSFVGGNVFYSTYFLSALLSLTAFYLLASRVATAATGTILACSILIFSKSFIDYSTSGLENPLSHALIVVNFLLAARIFESPSKKTASWYFLTCSFIYLSRPDLIILVFPTTLIVAYAYKSDISNVAKAIMTGASPALLWTVFSIFYYGFPLPNTAYAKLGSGIPLTENIEQGFRYLVDSLSRDPLTIIAISFGTIVGFKSSHLGKALSVGIVSYIAYIIMIGGDFMTGRFLSAPLLGSVMLISRADLTRQKFYLFLAGIFLLAAAGASGTLFSGPDYQNTKISASGIADERGFYFQKYGLVNASRQTFRTPTWSVAEPNSQRHVYTMCGGLGFSGIRSGPEFHLIDYCGLADPLLARLPAQYDENWRSGHFHRQLPENYERSVRERGNFLSDKETRELYAAIREITRLPLLAPERLKAIAGINFAGQKNDFEKYRFEAIPQETAIPAIMIGTQFSPLKEKPDQTMEIGKAVDFVLSSRQAITGFDLSLSGNGRYRIEFYSDGFFRNPVEIGPGDSATEAPFPYRHRLSPPFLVTERVRITPLAGNGPHSLSHAQFHYLAPPTP